MSKGEHFRALHTAEPFVIPNPWDAGSARVLETLGFKALATTSSAFAFTLGRKDGEATLEEVVAHTRAIADATSLPVSVDLENGHADPARAIDGVAEAGAVGGSIEDYDPAGRIYELAEAVERVAAAVEAARALDFPFTLTARAENHIRGRPELEDTIERLQAYARAGADVLYAPGLASLDDIRTVCQAVGKPVNVLARANLTFAELADAGVQRVSVGGALTRVALQAFVDAAVAIRDRGDFSAFAQAGDFDDFWA